ncbi:MAG: hypothetical protein EA402_00995 [Planctomycetota bacterium]|nr:MAG: hypothetical protein EA402_00995 [Planctomycetota bacterium]
MNDDQRQNQALDPVYVCCGLQDSQFHASVIQDLGQTYGQEALLRRLLLPADGPADSADIAAFIDWLGGLAVPALALALAARSLEVLANRGWDDSLQQLFPLLDDLSGAAATQALPKEISAQVAFAKAAVAIARDREDSFEEPYVQGLLALGNGHAAFSERLRNYALFLALRGRLMEIDALLHQCEGEVALSGEHSFIALRFINSLEIGNWEMATDLLPSLSHGDPNQEPLKEVLAVYDSVLVLRQSWTAGEPLRIDPLDDDEALQAFTALYQRDRRHCYSLIESSDYADVASPSTLFGYQSLRLALALRDDELAEDLLSQRQAQGLSHWLDDLIRCRIALQRGQSEEAGCSFARCLRHADHWHADGRLDFELRLAMEVTPLQLVWLGLQARPLAIELPPANPLNILARDVHQHG